MSEQEFAPQSNSERENEYSESSPYYWSTTPRKNGTPRDEPPSSIDEPIMPAQDYQAGYNGSAYDIPSYGEASQPPPKVVDATPPPYAQQQQQQQQQQQRPGFGPGWGNGPFQNQQGQQWGQWNTPGWARPRMGRNRGQIFWLFFLLIFFARPLFSLFAALVSGIGILISTLLVGFILLIGLLVLATIVTRILFRTTSGSQRYRRRYYNSWRRGPWWW
ncbi:MAG TPA: hypothetical protein VFN23_19075 [Ktedonobacteraceae bacterium]|nr:hypothetical protein [Ktedonobacteraceae bacterium]